MALSLDAKITLSENISSDSIKIIQISEEGLELILTRHFDKIKKSHDWISVLALFVTFIVTFLTTNFHDAYGLKADVIYAFFIFCCIASGIYLIYNLWNCFKNRDSIDKIINEIYGKCKNKD